MNNSIIQKFSPKAYAHSNPSRQTLVTSPTFLCLLSPKSQSAISKIHILFVRFQGSFYQIQSDPQILSLSSLLTEWRVVTLRNAACLTIYYGLTV